MIIILPDVFLKKKSKKLKKKYHGNYFLNLPVSYKKCPRSLHYTLLLTSSLFPFSLAFWFFPFVQSPLDEMMTQAEYMELHLNKGIHINI